MVSTPELSPPSSTTSSDDEYSFFSALSTSAFSLTLQTPSPIFLESPKMTVQYDAHDTQNPIYPLPRTSTQTPTWGKVPMSSPKPIADPQSHHQHRRGDSLPHNLHRDFHRPSHPSCVKFPETLPLNKPQLHGLRSPHPRCISNTMGTEVLISLAWTGEMSTVVSGYVPSRIGNTYMWPKFKISDTEMTATRRTSWSSVDDGQSVKVEGKDDGGMHQPHLNDTSSRPSRSKRWTLADAISDNGVTDEKLVELLEGLRLRRLRSTERSSFQFSFDAQTPTRDSPTSDNEPSDGNDTFPSPHSLLPDDVSKAWSTARRILLVCRELIRTERHYFLSLKTLFKGETQTPPSSLMLLRLPALINASGRFLELMEINPSALGICAAFIKMYELLEEAFVQWCEVVGEFFTTNPGGTSKSSVKRSNSVPPGSGTLVGDKSSSMLTKRVGSWGKKMHSKTLTIDDITSLIARNIKGDPQHKTPVRDLAIMPTQRITRYVLLFKDLLIHSPPPDTQVTIEHAAEAAMMLAQKADRAQDHVAFHMTFPT